MLTSYKKVQSVERGNERHDNGGNGDSSRGFLVAAVFVTLNTLLVVRLVLFVTPLFSLL